LRLEEFEERRKIRNILQNAIMNSAFLDSETIDLLDTYKDQMHFYKEEMGLILASLINGKKDFKEFFDRAKSHGLGIDIQPILRLLYSKDRHTRAKAVELLIEIQDKDMINPLLSHLKREDVLEIKDLVIKGIGYSGKKRAIIAIMNTLKEIGDRQLKLRAIELFHSLLGNNIKEILSEIREKEKDPSVLVKIDNILKAIEENGQSRAYKA